MGRCTHCDQQAGLWSNEHAGCALRNTENKAALIQLAIKSLDKYGETTFNDVESAASNLRMSDLDLRTILTNAWHSKINEMELKDEATASDLDRMYGLCSYFKLDWETELNTEKHTLRLLHMVTLGELRNGRIPSIVPTPSNMPFRMAQKEFFLWYFPNATFSKYKAVTRSVGESFGGSIRIAKGVYLRASEFRSRRIQEQKLEKIDSGEVYITTTHFCFAGALRHIRLPINDVVSLSPYSEGVSIQKTSENSLWYFDTGAGRFTYNILTLIIDGPSVCSEARSSQFESIDKDIDAEKLQLMELEIEKGNWEVAKALGWAYHSGTYISKDSSKSFVILMRAAVNGDAGAARLIGLVTADLTEKELETCFAILKDFGYGEQTMYGIVIDSCAQLPKKDGP